MKYKRPHKFKRAIKELISYLNASNGIHLSTEKEWQCEVNAVTEAVDPKDRKKFIKAADQLYFVGIEMGSAFQEFEATLNIVDRSFKELIKGIK